MKNDPSVFVYMYLREDGSPYYIGKGTKKRLSEHYSYSRNVHTPKDTSRIIVQEYESEEDTIKAEIFFISYYGRKDLGSGTLRNLTDGGEGCSGRIVREETRRRIRKSHIGKKHTEETKKRLREVHTGKVLSEEHKLNITKRLIGRPVSLETRRKISESHRGLKHSQESIEKMRASANKRVHAAGK